MIVQAFPASSSTPPFTAELIVPPNSSEPLLNFPVGSRDMMSAAEMEAEKMDFAVYEAGDEEIELLEAAGFPFVDKRPGAECIRKDFWAGVV